MSARTETCPRCNGKRSGYAFISRAGNCQGREIDCSFCGGRGEVTEREADLYREGERRRDERVLAGRSLREEAKRLGITPAELSAIERGQPAGASGCSR